MVKSDLDFFFKFHEPHSAYRQIILHRAAIILNKVVEFQNKNLWKFLDTFHRHF